MFAHSNANITEQQELNNFFLMLAELKKFAATVVETPAQQALLATVANAEQVLNDTAMAVPDRIESVLLELKESYFHEHTLQKNFQQAYSGNPQLLSWFQQKFIVLLLREGENSPEFEQVPVHEREALVNFAAKFSALTEKKQTIFASFQQQMIGSQARLAQLATWVELEQEIAELLQGATAWVAELARAQQDLLRANKTKQDFNYAKAAACLKNRLDQFRQIEKNLISLSTAVQQEPTKIINYFKWLDLSDFIALMPALQSPAQVSVLERYGATIAEIVYAKLLQWRADLAKRTEGISVVQPLGLIEQQDPEKLAKVLLMRVVHLERAAELLKNIEREYNLLQNYHETCEILLNYLPGEKHLDELKLLLEQQNWLLERWEERLKELSWLKNFMITTLTDKPELAKKLRYTLEQEKKYAELFWYDQTFHQQAQSERYEKVRRVYQQRLANPETQRINREIQSIFNELLANIEQFNVDLANAQRKIEQAWQSNNNFIHIAPQEPIIAYYVNKLEIIYQEMQYLTQSGTMEQLLQRTNKLILDYQLDQVAINLILTNPIEQNRLPESAQYHAIIQQLQNYHHLIENNTRTLENLLATEVASFNQFDLATQAAVMELLQERAPAFQAWCQRQLTNFTARGPQVS